LILVSLVVEEFLTDTLHANWRQRIAFEWLGNLSSAIIRE